MASGMHDGMIYFTTLEDVLNYKKSNHDLCIVPLQNYEDHTGKIKTLLCHDMQGGYLCFDRLSGASLNEEQPLYTFFHWWYIDVFIYFSHNFITVPPVVWINQAHRHGVTVLGTFITESNSGAEICCKLFSSIKNVNTLIDSMINLCVEFGFDGWLINIENPIEEAHLSVLAGFLSTLRARLKECIGERAYIIWYDSVTCAGKLAWQDELNVNNKAWFDAVDAIFLNYTWKPEKLKQSAERALSRRCEVFAGIDVFGRGQIGKSAIVANCRRFFGKRVFDRLSDGGWNCVEALAHVREAGLSAAIFAPGWICENFPNSCVFDQSGKFWELLRDLLPVNRRVRQYFFTNFHHGIDAKFSWFCMNNANLQPFYLGRGAATKSKKEITSNNITNFELLEKSTERKKCPPGLYADKNSARLDGEDEQILFLCDIPATYFAITAKTLRPALITVHSDNGELLTLRTRPDYEEVRSEYSLTELLVRSGDTTPQQRIECITIRSEDDTNSNYISLFSVQSL